MMQVGIFTGYFPYGLEETAKKMKKEADDKATAGVTKAKSERDRLVTEAEAKVAAGK